MHSFMKQLRGICVMSILAGYLVALPAKAEAAADILALLNAGQLAEADSTLNEALIWNPRDPQMRLLKGVLLEKQGQSDQAVAQYMTLISDFPGLPEPYNNLAILFAKSGRYNEARATLEYAVKAVPNYVTAYENLSDVYLKLASENLEKLLRIDPGNRNARGKQALILRSLATDADSASAAKSSTAKHTVGADKRAVLDIVAAWARAWGRGDLNAYFSFYGPNFRARRHQTRAQWESERRMRIAGKSDIDVRVENPKVVIDAGKATIRFRQVYVSGRLSSSTRKTLVLDDNGGRWQILEER